MERVHSAPSPINHTSYAEPVINCGFMHPDILLPVPIEPDADTDCQLGLSFNEVFFYREKVSHEALTNAGLTYLHKLRPFKKTPFIKSHIEAAARCFDLASRQFDYPAQLTPRKVSWARELKSLDKIKKTSDEERLALALHKIGVLKRLDWFCSPDSISRDDYVNRRIYQEALTIARIYQRQVKAWPALNTAATIQQANYLVVAAKHAPDISQEIRLLTRAQEILENIYKKDPEGCIEDPTFNFSNRIPYGFPWHWDFEQKPTLLAYVVKHLQHLTAENIPTKAAPSPWEAFTSMVTGSMTKLFV